jgi:hypothetical protein
MDVSKRFTFRSFEKPPDADAHGDMWSVEVKSREPYEPYTPMDAKQKRETENVWACLVGNKHTGSANAPQGA